MQAYPLQSATIQRFKIGMGSDSGCVSKEGLNRDCLLAIQGTCNVFACTQSFALLAIASGVGEDGNGCKASHIAVQNLSEILLPSLLGKMVDDNQFFMDLLTDSIRGANFALYQRNCNQQCRVAASITAVLVVGTTAYVASVGSARAYLYSLRSGLWQIKEDQSPSTHLTSQTAVTWAACDTPPVYQHPVNYLGYNLAVPIDTAVVPCSDQDVLLLCSDGLWKMIHDRDIERIASHCTSEPSTLCRLLIQAALNRGTDRASIIATSGVAALSPADVGISPCSMRR